MILSTLSGSKYLRIVINLLFHLNLKERVHQNWKNTQPIEFRYCFIRFSPYKSFFLTEFSEDLVEHSNFKPDNHVLTKYVGINY